MQYTFAVTFGTLSKYRGYSIQMVCIQVKVNVYILSVHFCPEQDKVTERLYCTSVHNERLYCSCDLYINKGYSVLIIGHVHAQVLDRDSPLTLTTEDLIIWARQLTLADLRSSSTLLSPW